MTCRSQTAGWVPQDMRTRVVTPPTSKSLAQVNYTCAAGHFFTVFVSPECVRQAPIAVAATHSLTCRE